MTIPDEKLDERQFQTLVDEAKRRIAQSCPEWTDHNVSDPGVTLIEQFAYMTEQLIYRVNRIPERMHIQLLDLLDIHLAPPVASKTLLQFRLTEPATERFTIWAHRTEVSTAEAGTEDAVVFRVAEDFTIEPVRPVAYVAFRAPLHDQEGKVVAAGRFAEVAVTDGTARPPGQKAETFSGEPQSGDAFYLGFAQSIAKLLLRVSVDVAQARGTGADPRTPPLVWEASCGDDPEKDWKPVHVTDTSAGLNVDGYIDLQLPQVTGTQRVNGHRHHWLRCRFLHPGPSPYTRPPVITKITAHAIGAAVTGVRAVRFVGEELEPSDGTAAQQFHVDNVPVLELDDDREYLTVLDPGAEQWVPWQRVDSFRDSEERDKHFRFDAATGEIELGPRIRTRDGWRRHGAVPPKGARLRMTAYRQAEGLGANVDAHTLTVMRKSIAGIAAVTNPAASEDGLGVETVGEAREKAALELRTRDRAVTAKDYEYLAGEASPNVARAHCAPPVAGGPIVVSVLPHPPLGTGESEQGGAVEKLLDLDDLRADLDLVDDVQRYLDERRVLGASLHVQPAPLRQVTVVVHAVIAPLANGDAARKAIRRALFRFVNPLVGGEVTGCGDGWEFGRSVDVGDLFTVVQAVEPVMQVPTLRIYGHHPLTGRRDSEDAGASLDIDHDQVACSGDHIVRVTTEER